MKTNYQRIPHAAHYAYTHPAMGHDLEQWDVEAPTLTDAYLLGTMPRDARYHGGYRTREGVQHWIFTRTAPLSPGKCDRC